MEQRHMSLLGKPDDALLLGLLCHLFYLLAVEVGPDLDGAMACKSGTMLACAVDGKVSLFYGTCFALVGERNLRYQRLSWPGLIDFAIQARIDAWTSSS